MDLSMTVLSLTLLLLGLSSFVKAETCPEPEDLYPCICKEREQSGDIEVDCDFEKKGEIDLERLRKLLTSLSGKNNVHLYLKDCTWPGRLATIPSNFFSGIGIKHLRFQKCYIESLSTDNQPPLLGLENHLEKLEILMCFMGENGLTDLNFRHLQKLKDLEISANRITELGNDWLSKLPNSLEILRLSNNEIVKVGDRPFANLVNLRQLTFQGTILESLQRSMFPNPATKLEELTLRFTGLTTLPEDIFSNMPALRKVDLFRNEILRLDQRTWQPVWKQLTEVNVEVSPIQCDDSMNWIFGIRECPHVYGWCENLEVQKGFKQFIHSYIQSKKKRMKQY